MQVDMYEAMRIRKQTHVVEIAHRYWLDYERDEVITALGESYFYMMAHEFPGFKILGKHLESTVFQDFDTNEMKFAIWWAPFPGECYFPELGYGRTFDWGGAERTTSAGDDAQAARSVECLSQTNGRCPRRHGRHDRQLLRRGVERHHPRLDLQEREVMAIDVHCSVPSCGLPMVMPGAVLISPPLPNGTAETYVEKFHICALCWATRFKYMFGNEFRNDVAQWPHAQTPYPSDPVFFQVANPPAVPLTVDEELKVVEPTSLGFVALWKKDPTVVEMDPEIDVVKILGRDLRTKAEDDMEKYFAGLEDNRLVPNYSVKDAELMTLYHETIKGCAYRKPASKHPIWDLIKRGWL